MLSPASFWVEQPFSRRRGKKKEKSQQQQQQQKKPAPDFPFCCFSYSTSRNCSVAFLSDLREGRERSSPSLRSCLAGGLARSPVALLHPHPRLPRGAGRLLGVHTNPQPSPWEGCWREHPSPLLPCRSTLSRVGRSSHAAPRQCSHTGALTAEGKVWGPDATATLPSHLAREACLLFFLSQLLVWVSWHTFLPAALLPPQPPTHPLPCSNSPNTPMLLYPPKPLSSPERGKSNIRSITKVKMQSWAKISNIFLAGVHEHHFPPQPEIGALGGPAPPWGSAEAGLGGSRSLGALQLV